MDSKWANGLPQGSSNQDFRHNNTDELTLCSWNIQRGFINKEPEISDVLTNNDIDYLFIQESDVRYFTSTTFASYIPTLPLAVEASSKARIILLTRPELLSITSIRTDLMSPLFPSIWVEISGHILICGLYREWRTETEDNVSVQQTRFSILLDQVNSACQSGKQVVILGDFNLDLNRFDDSKYPLKSLVQDLQCSSALNDLHLIPMGNTFLCQRQTVEGLQIIESAIDFGLVSGITSGISPTILKNGLSNHLPILFKIPMVKYKREKCPPTTITGRSYQNFDYDGFQQHLKCQPNWKILETMTDVNEMVGSLQSFIALSLDEFAPMKTLHVGPNYRHEPSEETKEAMRERDQARLAACSAVKTMKNDAWNIYKRLRNKCTKLSRRDTRAEAMRLISDGTGSQNIWALVNKLTKNKEQDTIRIKKSDGVVTDDPRLVSQMFNEFFIKKPEELRKLIDPSMQENPLWRLKQEFEKRSRKPHFSLTTVREQDVKRHIKALKNSKSTGLDGVTTDIVKRCASFLTTPITYIINYSITSGVFPLLWKTSKVIPVHKGGKSDEIENFRPISLPSVMSKIIENVVKEQITEFVENNDILPPSQHGFRKKRSTTTALLSMMSSWREELLKHRYVGALLFDLTAAFDCLDTVLLCQKLEVMGFDKASINWISSFLQGRVQRVVVGKEMSDLMESSHGSSQGSVLSPLLFSLYVSDLPLWTNATITSYADDTTASIGGDDIGGLLKTLELEAHSMLKFMSSNWLVANPSKTKFLLIHGISRDLDMSLPSPVLMVGNCKIPAAKSVKILGIEVTGDLTGKMHFDSTISTIKQRLGILDRLSTHVPRSFLAPVVHGLIISVLKHGLAIYSEVRTFDEDSASDQMTQLQTLLNRVMGFMTGTKVGDKVSLAQLIEITKIPPINHLAAKAIISETFNALNCNIPHVSDHFTFRDAFSAQKTRRSMTKKPRVPHLTRHDSSGFVPKAIKLWNTLPESLKAESDGSLFKKSLDKHIKTMPI